MTRKSQHIIAFAVLVTVVLVYTFYPRIEDGTWQVPIAAHPSPPSIPPSLTHAPSTPGGKNDLPKLPELDHGQNPEVPSNGPAKLPDTQKSPDGVVSIAVPSSTPVTCVKYEQLQKSKQQPWSKGWRKFPYSRPPKECRTFNLPSMEKLIEKMKGVIKDPDLSRLFENSFPNTLDTMIKWRGYANKKDPETGEEKATDEELTYVITGDIDAMWLRDSASQVYSYISLLEPSKDPDSLASLWRGLINAHARYITISPYCHSFQPPPESGVPVTRNGAYSQNHPNPPYDPQLVFDCKWELDSLASFLQISVAYYEKTNGML